MFIYEGAASLDKSNGIKIVDATVAAGTASIANTADTDLIGGTVLGIYPATNQDQFVDNVALNATTGVLTVTLAANATANNIFKVPVLLRTGN